MYILLIEDDPTLSANIQTALRAEGFAVDAVYDGLLAERMLQQHSFDCIIMDINLPGKTGFDLCRDFRQRNKRTPVLMLTAFGELEDKAKGFDCGADDYLTKPFFMRELLLRINALLKRAQQTGSLSGLVAFRVDELLFDLIGELGQLYPDFAFEVNYQPEIPDEKRLEVTTHKMLLQQALLNLLTNAIAYASDKKAEVIIDATSLRSLSMRIANNGLPLDSEEEQYLFEHFFRGKNSTGSTGFGLGLVLARKIMELHGGSISYAHPWEERHVFEVRF